MTYEQLVVEVRRLPVPERLRLLEVIASSVREEEERSIPRGVPASSIDGILKTEGPTPLDAELQDDYVDYLIEKYS